MGEPRVFSETVPLDGPLVGDAWMHLFTVLKVRTGDTVRLVCGDGCEYRMRVSKAERRQGWLDLVERRTLPAGPRLQLTLAVGLLKGDHMDQVVQVATELGVHTLQPMRTLRSVSRESDGRVERWRRIAQTAMAQCGRAVCLQVAPVAPLDEVLKQCRDTGVMFWEAQTRDQPLAGFMAGKSIVTALVGPEGGFDAKEAERARSAGVAVASLGDRILRAQTAAMVAPALILQLAGDLA